MTTKFILKIFYRGTNSKHIKTCMPCKKKVQIYKYFQRTKGNKYKKKLVTTPIYQASCIEYRSVVTFILQPYAHIQDMKFLNSVIKYTAHTVGPAIIEVPESAIAEQPSEQNPDKDNIRLDYKEIGNLIKSRYN